MERECDRQIPSISDLQHTTSMLLRPWLQEILRQFANYKSATKPSIILTCLIAKNGDLTRHSPMVFISYRRALEG
jgi:hypothetical protein